VSHLVDNVGTRVLIRCALRDLAWEQQCRGEA
jgi:hypothetical protein